MLQNPNIRIELKGKRKDTYNKLFDKLVDKKIIRDDITATKFIDVGIDYALKYFKHEKKIKTLNQLKEIINEE